MGGISSEDECPPGLLEVVEGTVVSVEDVIGSEAGSLPRHELIGPDRTTNVSDWSDSESESETVA